MARKLKFGCLDFTKHVLSMLKFRSIVGAVHYTCVKVSLIKLVEFLIVDNGFNTIKNKS